MSFIKVDNITKTFKVAKRNSGLKAALKSFFKREYKIVEAVKNVSFEIKKGEVIGYIGPNGAGKSTTIKMLSGILLPTSGSIKINNLDPIKDRKKYVSKIGVVFGQRSQLAFDIPAEDTFDLLRDIYKIDNNEYQKTKKYLVELLGIEEIIKKPVRTLSLGERMRCEIASSLLHKPEILFLVTALNLFMHILTMFTLDEKGSMTTYSVIADIFMGGTVPIPFFPTWLKHIAEFLPFRFIGDFPFRIYSNSIPLEEGYILIIGSIIWIIITISLGYLISRVSLRKAVIQGG